jgi:prephenate dehydratase
MNVATLGPEGTFCHQVAMKTCPDAQLFLQERIDDIFARLEEGVVSLIIVPFKNTLSGNVEETLENLKKHSTCIVQEVQLVIEYALAGFGCSEEVKTILAHPHSFRQCEKAIRKQFPNALHVTVKSNAEAARLCLEKKDRALAAIVPRQTREMYHLPFLSEEIALEEENITTFLLLESR